jgi:hypothetical protein
LILEWPKASTQGHIKKFFEIWTENFEEFGGGGTFSSKTLIEEIFQKGEGVDPQKPP